LIEQYQATAPTNFANLMMSIKINGLSTSIPTNLIVSNHLLNRIAISAPDPQTLVSSVCSLPAERNVPQVSPLAPMASELAR